MKKSCKLVTLLTVATGLAIGSNSFAAIAGLCFDHDPISCFPLSPCAPEVQESNLATAQQTLNGLANNELRGQNKFHTLVASAQGMPEKQRMSAYLQLVGVQSSDEIIAFVSARSIDEKYIRALEANADLSALQANLVARRLSQALIGQQN